MCRNRPQQQEPPNAAIVPDERVSPQMAHVLRALAVVLWEIAGNQRQQKKKAAGCEPAAKEGVRDRARPQPQPSSP